MLCLSTAAALRGALISFDDIGQAFVLDGMGISHASRSRVLSPAPQVPMRNCRCNRVGWQRAMFSFREGAAVPAYCPPIAAVASNALDHRHTGCIAVHKGKAAYHRQWRQ